MPDVILGLDLGKRADHTALADLYRGLRLESDGRVARDTRGRDLYRYQCTRLHRWPKGTDYTDVIADLREKLKSDRFPDPTRIVVDTTGVGGGVVEMLLNAAIPKLEIVPILITAGRTYSRERIARNLNGYSVAKYLIASNLQAIFQGRHIRIRETDPLAKTLVKELMNFQVKITPAGNEKFEHKDGDHDDLVLALALPLWVGSQTRLDYLGNARVGETARESQTLEEERKGEEEARKKQKEDDDRRAADDWSDINNPIWWR